MTTPDDHPKSPIPDTPTAGFRLAVHESLLPGDTEAERVAAAATLGITGIEYNADGLGARVPSILTALDGAGVVAAGVHLGWQHNLLHAEEPVRQAALDAMRTAFTHANDLNAGEVIVIPHIGRQLGLPDLMPFKAPMQIAVELMIWHLRAYSDLAYVFDLTLLLHPVSPYESAFLNRLTQGVELRRRIKFNPYVWLAADIHQMTTAEPQPVIALTEHREHVRRVYLSENDGSLPGEGATDFGAVHNALNGGSGWAVIQAYNQPVPPTQAQLRASVAHLRLVGFAG